MYPVTIALLISGAAAASVPSLTSNPFAPLLPRQSQTSGFNPSEIPASCQSICTGIVTDLKGCTSNACLCTSSVRNDFSLCLNCLVSVSNGESSIISAAQQSVSEYESACQSSGEPIAPISIDSPSATSSGDGGPVTISGATISTPTPDAGSGSDTGAGSTGGGISGGNGGVGAGSAGGVGTGSAGGVGAGSAGGVGAGSAGSGGVGVGSGGAGTGAGTGGAGFGGNSPANSAPTGSSNGKAHLPGSYASRASAHTGLSVVALAIGAVATLW